MHRGLPVSVFIESVDFSSSESEFGASVNSTLVRALEKSSSGSRINSCVPSTNDVSICNAVNVN